ncbi:hypothetical protein Nepgr_002860 [Nepenthes gracilis]|uniref:SET domain-containing protein n=1 Tax=Nepenthes gracilis TaxID=150966 RepID=A0AAD3P7L6_NEPGR|nr:hypothetical protein Nepgr_002860 [Nepenthes gracilis]
METRVEEDIGMGQDITPPLPPLSFSLYDSCLHSHCSSCFLSLSPSSPRPATALSPFLAYCSSKCALVDSLLHLSSAEHHLFLLLRSHPSAWPHGDSSDLRASLRLLRLLELLHLLPSPLPNRLAGLMTNRDKLASASGTMPNDENLVRIRDGARVMAMARSMRDGKEFGGKCEVEEAVLCLVLTNAVEVRVNGEMPLGIAVYDRCFSWINHSCSPNTYYRFTLFSEVLAWSNHKKLRMIPVGDEIIADTGASCVCELAKGFDNYGPRMTVRSITAIKRGEEVTVTYTDLLQPTTIRQSELWLKYQFFCCCRRCNAVPQTYLDHCLRETFSPNFLPANTSSINFFPSDEAIGKLKDYFDTIIAEYMSVGNPASCCEKIENLLTRCLADELLEPDKGSSPVDFRLSLLHHLALNAYTTLYSTYKIRADLHVNGMQLQAFDMSRTSTAYCLLLAGATHHLFLSEISLIASAATFWMSAGESLLCLARNSFWDSIAPHPLPLSIQKCVNCPLLENFEGNFSCTRDQSVEFDETSQQFLYCISVITPTAWSFLVQGCHYLKDIKDPINFSWLGAIRTSYIGDFHAQLGHNELYSSYAAKGNIPRSNELGPGSEERTSTFQLGVHCLVYGGYLSGICYGHHSYMMSYMQNLLYG